MEAEISKFEETLRSKLKNELATVYDKQDLRIDVAEDSDDLVRKITQSLRHEFVEGQSKWIQENILSRIDSLANDIKRK